MGREVGSGLLAIQGVGNGDIDGDGDPCGGSAVEMGSASDQGAGLAGGGRYGGRCVVAGLNVAGGVAQVVAPSDGVAALVQWWYHHLHPATYSHAHGSDQVVIDHNDNGISVSLYLCISMPWCKLGMSHGGLTLTGG